MANISIYEFRSVLDSGDVLEPPYKSVKNFAAGSDTYVTENNCVAVQITCDANIRITTDGTQVDTLDRFIAANQLATLIFETAGQRRINTAAA